MRTRALAFRFFFGFRVLSKTLVVGKEPITSISDVIAFGVLGIDSFVRFSILDTEPLAASGSPKLEIKLSRLSRLTYQSRIYRTTPWVRICIASTVLIQPCGPLLLLWGVGSNG